LVVKIFNFNYSVPLSNVFLISQSLVTSSIKLFIISSNLSLPPPKNFCAFINPATRVEANHLFRRLTDQFIKSKIGKQLLDVGADRIARTAHAALTLLDEIRIKIGEVIPLAWETGLQAGIFAIEVYPAATLIAHDISIPGYKRKENREARKTLLSDLRKRIDLPPDISLMENNDDALDAAICVLAGSDF
jgi:hypothetical protein